jgi:two-component system, LuxR family, sensor kinase FixL
MMDSCRTEIKELSILRGAVENANEAFVTIDESHRVIFFNKAAEDIFGFKREEVLGLDLDVIMTSECSTNHRLAVENYLKTRIPKLIGHENEMIVTRKGGEKFPATISFSVSEVEGKLYFTGIVRDLTEKKALQEQIIRSEKLAALGQVAAEITHEIKNPLMMIGGFAKQLIRQTADEGHLGKLNIIVDEVLRLENLLNELKMFYQKRELNIERVDMNALVEEVLSLAENGCTEKNIHIQFTKKQNALLFEGDRDKMKQVLLNLVKNALDAMGDGGVLVIQTQRTNGYLETTVSDNGCGIPACDLEKILSPFYTTKKRGTGLGLSISKNIVEAHKGGTLTLTSQEGKGSTFKVSLPVLSETQSVFDRP